MLENEKNGQWQAIYTDCSTLNQYDNIENSFKDIDQKRLFEFRLLYNGRIISLFMPTGTFGINGLLYDTDISGIADVEYRLVHFVRRRKNLGPGKQLGDTFYLGFQMTKDGNNHKRLLAIWNNHIQFEDENGRI